MLHTQKVIKNKNKSDNVNSHSLQPVIIDLKYQKSSSTLNISKYTRALSLWGFLG